MAEDITSSSGPVQPATAEDDNRIMAGYFMAVCSSITNMSRAIAADPATAAAICGSYCQTLAAAAATATAARQTAQKTATSGQRGSNG